jgi:hypothetical protein
MARPRKENEHDWPAIYADWLTGTMTNKDIGRKHGVTGATIGQRIKREQWTTINGPRPKSSIIQPAEPATPKVRTHKPDVSKSMTVDQLRKRAKDLAQRLLAEVEDVTTYEGEIGDIIEAEESDTMRRRAAMKALSTGERVKNLKELTAIIDAVDGKKAKAVKEAASIPEGKKAQRQEAAERAATSGVFAVPSPPKLVSSK